MKSLGQQGAAAGKGIIGSFTELSSVIGLARQGVALARTAFEETAGAFSTYALSVRDMARSTGGSVEEMSRLVQVADDVAVSQGALQVAMRRALMQGISPSTEGLAKLADQYLALAPGVERSRFLLKTFGRSGLEMGKLLEKGGAGIRNMSAAVSENLIVTKAGAEAAEAFRVKQDELADVLEAVKLGIGSLMLTDLVAFLGGVTVAGEGVVDVFKFIRNGIAEIAPWYESNAEKLKAAANMTQEEAFAIRDALWEVGGAAEDMAGDIEAGTTALQAYYMQALGAGVVSAALREAMSDGFVSQEELQTVRDFAEAHGVELPADIDLAVKAFNRFKEEGIDPATASAEELNDALTWAMRNRYAHLNFTIKTTKVGDEDFDGAGDPDASPFSSGEEGDRPTFGPLQHGGFPGPGVYEVGERGTEGLVVGRGGVEVVEHGRWLAMREGRRVPGLAGGAVMMDGGGSAPVTYPYYPSSPNEPGGNPDVGWSPLSTWGGGGGGGTAVATAQAAAVAAQEVIPAVVQAAVQGMTVAASQGIEQQMQQAQAQRAEARVDARETQGLLRELIAAVGRVATDTGVAEAMQKVDFR